MSGATLAEKIDYIELPSSDRAASSAFFDTAFGWSSISYGSHYDALDDAGIGAGINQHADRTQAPLAIIRTDNIDDAQRRVMAAGGTITRAQFDFPGGRRFHFREPGGNEMAVWIAHE